MSALVSVYIITHNRMSMLKKAVDSVLAQTYENIEIIIVNDASQDGTREYLNELDFPECRVFHNEECRGACYSRNLAINKASGEFITGLDDDDVFSRKRVEVLLKKYNKDCSFVYSDDLIVDEKNKISFLRQKKTFSLNKFFRWNIVGNQIFTETYKIRNVLFDEELPSAQDYDCFLRMVLEYGEPLRVSEPLQHVYINYGLPTISRGNSFVSGYYKFYKKHQSKMNDYQRRYQLTNILLKREKRIGRATFFSLFDLWTFKYLVKLYFCKR